MARTSITIVLELDPTADSPVGHARLPDDAQHAFHGWLGLAEAIDSLVARAQGAATLPSADPSPAVRGAQGTERSPSP